MLHFETHIFLCAFQAAAEFFFFDNEFQGLQVDNLSHLEPPRPTAKFGVAILVPI